MPQIYIIRDDEGRIERLAANAEPGAVAGSVDDPEVKAYLRGLDTDLVRVLEDLVDLLTSQGVFRFTDLPESAQQKLLFRKNLRSQWQPVPNPLDDDDLI